MTLFLKNYEELPLTLKVDQVAEILGVSRKVAYNLAKSDNFPAVRVGKKRLCIPRDKFLQWLNENAEKPIY